jgi:MoxR-like ATPase
LRNLEEYRQTFLALSVCIEARLPVVLWGPPGQGKTSVLQSIAEKQNRPMETLLASIREPQDFAGLPSIVDGRAHLVAPDWAHRLAAAGNGILFTDEVNTAPPSVQAALLRVCLDKVAGDCELGENTSVVAAANPPELAADGWDLAPPLANRFCHLNWALPSEVLTAGLTGSWPDFDLPELESDLQKVTAEERSILAGFISSRPDLTTVVPESTSEQGRAFPTPRSWEMLATLVSYARSRSMEEGVIRLLAVGVVGPGPAMEFLNYRKNLDLPDPELVLKNADVFSFPERTDHIYVILAGAMNVVTRRPSDVETWEQMGKLLERVANAGHPDLAVNIAKSWLRIKPQGAMPNPELLKALVPLMKTANLI